MIAERLHLWRLANLELTRLPSVDHVYLYHCVGRDSPADRRLIETARKGITVNCVTPGFVETDMVAAVPDTALQAVMARIPVGRLGRPEEVANAVRFLLDNNSAYITGAILAVNGGLDM
jgi:hypothetical protein